MESGLYLNILELWYIHKALLMFGSHTVSKAFSLTALNSYHSNNYFVPPLYPRSQGQRIVRVIADLEKAISYVAIQLARKMGFNTIICALTQRQSIKQRKDIASIT